MIVGPVEIAVVVVGLGFYVSYMASLSTALNARTAETIFIMVFVAFYHRFPCKL